MASCTIRFKYDAEKFVNAVAYFASKNVPDLSTLKVAKLMYYADKLHLQHYGRPVTGDVYVAMDLGPVPSASYNIMTEALRGSTSYDGIHEYSVELFEKFLDIDKTPEYPEFRVKRAPDLDVFSDSDIYILDEVIEHYGFETPGRLVNKTHQEATWKRTASNSMIDFHLFLDELDQDQRKMIIALIEHDQEDRDIFELSQ